MIYINIACVALIVTAILSIFFVIRDSRKSRTRIVEKKEGDKKQQ